MAAHHNVPDVIHDTAQLQGGRLTAEELVLKVVRMRNNVSGISHFIPLTLMCAHLGCHATARLTHKHVAHMCFREPGRDHPAVHACEEDRFGLKWATS